MVLGSVDRFMMAILEAKANLNPQKVILTKGDYEDSNLLNMVN